jgi:hypothetical protein
MWEWIKANKGKAAAAAGGIVTTAAGAVVALDAAGAPLPAWVKPVASIILSLFGGS